MIKKITLQYGSESENKTLKFDPSSVTVFVGPNNSGKSLLLREIETFCSGGLSGNLNILSKVDVHLPTDKELSQNIKTMERPFDSNESHRSGAIKYGRFHSTKGFVVFRGFDIQTLCHWKNSPEDFTMFMRHYISMYVSHFGGKERFDLVKKVPFFNLKFLPPNSLSCLFQDNNKRTKVRSLIHKAFDKYFVIDPTSMTELEIRLSDIEPSSEDIERNWTKQSVQFHKKAKSITDFSDGVQAFTGLIMTVIAGEEKIILLDEPEAFLHPSLTNLLGEELSTLMSKREGNLIVATHSPFFIMGCLQSGKNLNIIRLTYNGTHSTVRLLEPDKVKELFKNPLLRSIGVLQSLFYSAVIVTEGDTDRAFYNEINERMLAQSNSDDGVANALFLNAQNKQTIWNIVAPLRNMGIPAVGIVDIDFIKDGGQNFTNLLNASGIPSVMHDSLSTTRSKLSKNFDSLKTKTGKDMKNGGVLLLEKDEEEMAENFLNDLANYGVFVVANGELESWLKNLNCTGYKANWLIQIFEKIGSDPENSEYITPNEGDVWGFLRSISKWVNDPNRKGMKNL